MKRIIGYCLLASPFAAIAGASIYAGGVLFTLAIVGVVVLVIGVIWAGVELVNS